MTPIIARFLTLVCIPVIIIGLVIGVTTSAGLSTKKVAINSHKVTDSKDTGLLGQLTKNILQLVPSATPSPTSSGSQETNTSNSQTNSNANNTNSPTNAAETHVTATPMATTAVNTTPTAIVTQIQPSKTPSATPTNIAPTPTPIFTQLVVLGCYDFGLNYCRQGLPSNGSVYGGRLRVKNASTGELLASATLNSGGGTTVTGLPIDKELEIILLPPTDQPNYCGDREYVKFLSYRTYISVELDLYRDATPCITN